MQPSSEIPMTHKGADEKSLARAGETTPIEWNKSSRSSPLLKNSAALEACSACVLGMKEGLVAVGRGLCTRIST